MKILIHTEGAGAHHYQRLGWARAFSAADHEVCLWTNSAKPAYDIFDEFQPDIFLGQTYNLDRATVKCLKNNPCYVGLRASDHSKFSRKIKKDGFNVLTANEEEVEAVKQVEPQFLHSYYPDNRIGELHEDWHKMGFNSIGCMLAADVFEYTNGVPDSKYSCDIGFVGGYWPYKGQNIDRYLLPLCQDKYDYNIKIFGNQGWGVPQYCGWIDDSNVKHFLASAQVCPNVSEPHATEFGYDVNERIFKLLANKCLVVSDHVEAAQEIFGSAVLWAKDPEEFKKSIDVVLADHHDDIEVFQDMVFYGYNLVIENHTYFHRCKQIFAEFGLVEEVDKMDEAYIKTKELLGL